MGNHKRRVEARHTDEGYGFPVTWRDVPVIKVHGEWLPDVDFTSSEYVNAVLFALAISSMRLSGRHVRFIRQSWGLTLDKFGSRFSVSRQAVMKWERTGGNPTLMDWATEKDMRLSMLKRVGVDPTKFIEAYEELTNVPEAVKDSVPLELRAMEGTPARAA